MGFDRLATSNWFNVIALEPLPLSYTDEIVQGKRIQTNPAWGQLDLHYINGVTSYMHKDIQYAIDLERYTIRFRGGLKEDGIFKMPGNHMEVIDELWINMDDLLCGTVDGFDDIDLITPVEWDMPAARAIAAQIFEPATKERMSFIDECLKMIGWR